MTALPPCPANLDESRLNAAVAAVREQVWCPSVAQVPTYELQTLLSIAIRAYWKAVEPPPRKPTPAPAPRPQPSRRVKGPAQMPSKREQVLSRDNRVCYHCEKPIPKYEESIDHVVARARGGTNDMGNLRAAHKLCNRRKGHLSLEEYLLKYPLEGKR
jgi:hypothetical protein